MRSRRSGFTVSPHNHNAKYFTKVREEIFVAGDLMAPREELYAGGVIGGPGIV